MKSKKTRPKSVAGYIAAAPAKSRKKLREMRACVRGATKGAVEGMKWGMPAYSDTRILVMFAGFKGHVSLFPTARVVGKFEKELKKFAISRGTVQFPLGKPLPKALIRRMVAYRIRLNKEMAAKWRS